MKGLDDFPEIIPVLKLEHERVNFGSVWHSDPGLALAHAGAGVCLFLEERFEEARAAIETARTAVGQTPRERGHVEAVALLVAGKSAEAEPVMREHLNAYPRDLLVLQRLYFIWFWQGRFPAAYLAPPSSCVRRPEPVCRAHPSRATS